MRDDQERFGEMLQTGWWLILVLGGLVFFAIYASIADDSTAGIGVVAFAALCAVVGFVSGVKVYRPQGYNFVLRILTVVRSTSLFGTAAVTSVLFLTMAGAHLLLFTPVLILVLLGAAISIVSLVIERLLESSGFEKRRLTRLGEGALQQFEQNRANTEYLDRAYEYFLQANNADDIRRTALLELQAMGDKLGDYYPRTWRDRAISFDDVLSCIRGLGAGCSCHSSLFDDLSKKADFRSDEASRVFAPIWLRGRITIDDDWRSLRHKDIAEACENILLSSEPVEVKWCALDALNSRHNVEI